VSKVSEAPLGVRQVSPTLAAARALDPTLPAAAPREVLPLAVLRVACRATFRKSWPEHPEMPAVDSVGTLSDVYVPTPLRTASGFLHVERRIEAVVPVIPDLAFECADLRPVTEESAYRGARRQQDPEFYGFDFDDTIALAKRGTNDFMLGKGKLLTWQIRAWGWPLLWLRWPGETPDAPPLEVVVIADAEGVLHRIGSDDAPEG
jgi:hypothetical protein